MAIALAVGNTAATSADVTIAAGSSLSVYLTPAPGAVLDPFDAPAYAISIDRKDDAGNYYELLKLADQMGSLILYGAGTFRFRRSAQTVAIGVETA